MSKVGKSEIRVDAFDKVTGRTKYYEDRMPAGALYARIKHSTIAHGFVKSVDKSAAEAIPGVVKVLTCFDVPEHCFPTAGHPWSMDPGHQDVKDRLLLNRHVRYYGDDIAVVHHDNYYKRQNCSFEERCRQNDDHPDAFDTELMIEDLKALKRGETIHCPVYDYAIHNRTDETVEIQPTKVVIVEGILIFQSKELRDLLDIKIFVETDADVRILRRALRDVEERGRSMQSVVTQYLTTVKPMHEQFVEPTRKYADIVVLEGGHNLVALDLIMQRIANHIAEK